MAGPIQSKTFSSVRIFFTVLTIASALILGVMYLLVLFWGREQIIAQRDAIYSVMGILMPLFGLGIFIGIYFAVKNLIWASEPEQKNKLYLILESIWWFFGPSWMVALIMRLYVLISVAVNLYK